MPAADIPNLETLTAQRVTGVQKALSSFINMNRYNMLVQAPYEPAEMESFAVHAHTIAFSAKDSVGSQWLTANPRFVGSRLDNTQFDAACRFRLGLRGVSTRWAGDGGGAANTPTIETNPAEFNQAAMLKSINQGYRSSRHGDMNRNLCAALRRLGYTGLRMEVPVKDLYPPKPGNTTVHRADFLPDPSEQPRLIYDLTVRAAKYDAQFADAKLGAAQQAYNKKTAHYTNKYEVSADRVKPIALDQFGRLAAGSAQALKQLLSNAARNDTAERLRAPMRRRRLLEAMSIALMRGNSRILYAHATACRKAALPTGPPTN